jgi:hypothetical protein
MADLCLSCGLCCDGSLFATICLSPEDAQRIEARKLPLLPIDGGTEQLAAEQPCGAFAGRCTVFADRPAVCQHYRCDVLKAVEGGALPEQEAALLVVRARALAASVRAAVPGRRSLRRDVARWSEDSPEWRRANGGTLVDLAALRQLLRRFDTAPWG